MIPELRNEDTESIKNLRNKLIDADVIYFIGFSYDPLNLHLLGFPLKSKNSNLRIHGTVYGMEDGEIINAKLRVRIETPSGHVELKPANFGCDAYTFFRKEVIKSFV